MLVIVDVAEKVGRSTSVIERAIAELKVEGKLSYVGPKKGGRWEVL